MTEEEILTDAIEQMIAILELLDEPKARDVIYRYHQKLIRQALEIGKRVL